VQDCFGSIQVAMKDVEEGEGVGENRVERVVVVVRKKEWEEMFERKERADGRRAKSRSVGQVKRRKGFMLHLGFTQADSVMYAITHNVPI